MWHAARQAADGAKHYQYARGDIREAESRPGARLQYGEFPLQPLLPTTGLLVPKEGGAVMEGKGFDCGPSYTIRSRMPMSP